jgi:signal transduction histidine kinase
LLLRGMNRSNVINEFMRSSPGAEEATVGELIGTYAQAVGVRVIRFQVDRDGVPYVVYDSDDYFTVNEQLPAQFFDIRNGAPDSQSLLNLGGALHQIHGTFRQDGAEWLFSGFVNDPRPRVAQRRDNETSGLITASLRPTQSLQGVLTDFGADLFLPLLQASIIGLLIAFVLAYLISRTIAKPLQSLSQAATAIAHGDLEQKASLDGPHEIRALADAFNYMSEEVRKTQQAQRDFLANVSHDLKTPLTSIQGYSQAIIDGTAKQPELAAGIIYEESERLTRMVIMLTDLARMQAGHFELNMTQLDVSDVVNAVVHRLNVMANKKNITLTVNAPSLPTIGGDGDRLVQVFNNLVDNAIKYTGEGGRVHVIARDSHDGVEVVIKDNGIGIPARDLPRIFERFYQVDKARGPKRGTGLGLAITYEILQQHHGKISVQSIEGQGTQFTVWLPYAPDSSTITRRSVSARRNASA